MKRILTGLLLCLPLILNSGNIIFTSNGVVDISRDYPTVELSAISLTSSLGNINIISSDSFFVEIEKHVYEVESDSGLYLLDLIEVGTVIENQVKKYLFTGPSLNFPEDVKYSVNFNCHIPRTMNVFTEVTAGNIDIYNLYSQVSVILENGNITMSGGYGSIDISSINSNTDIRWSLSAEDHINIEQDNGNIQLIIPMSSSVEAEFGVQNGIAEYSHFEAKFTTVEGGPNHYRLKIGEGRSKINISLNRGNILLRGY